MVHVALFGGAVGTHLEATHKGHQHPPQLKHHYKTQTNPNSSYPVAQQRLTLLLLFWLPLAFLVLLASPYNTNH